MKRVLIGIALACSISVLAAACAPTQNSQRVDSAGSIVGEGTVHRGVGPECPDVWHVTTAQGAVLWPVEDPALKVEGLRVRFKARERSDTASICMAGKNVEFSLLEKL